MPIPQTVFDLGIPDLMLAAQLAEGAGKLIIDSVSRRLIPRHSKGGDHGDLASAIDHASQRLIVEGLFAKGVTADEILAEEAQDDLGVVPPNLSTYREPAESGRKIWVVDPVDCSKGVIFRRDLDLVSVMIAQRENGKTNFGVVHVPRTNDWFFAAAGCGAFGGTKLIANSSPALTIVDTAIEFNLQTKWSLVSPEVRRLWERVGDAGVTARTARSPHSLANCHVAWGSIHAVVHDGSDEHPKQLPWDRIPGQIIATETPNMVMVGFDGEPMNVFDNRPYIAAQSLSLARELIALAL